MSNALADNTSTPGIDTLPTPFEQITAEVPNNLVGTKLPAGVRRIIRVNRDAHVHNARNVGYLRYYKDHPTTLVIEDGLLMRTYHNVVFRNGSLCEYKDPQSGNLVVGIVTYDELCCYSKPDADPSKLPSEYFGC